MGERDVPGAVHDGGHEDAEPRSFDDERHSDRERDDPPGENRERREALAGLQIEGQVPQAPDDPADEPCGRKAHVAAQPRQQEPAPAGFLPDDEDEDEDLDGADRAEPWRAVAGDRPEERRPRR